MLILSILYLLSSVAQGRIGNSTQYDGQMNNYNTYLRFGGSVGLLYQEPYTTNLQSYSASIWVRLNATPTDMSRPLQIFTLQPGFQCYFNIRFRVQCNSDRSSNNMQLEGSIRLSNWYILTVRSQSSTTLIQMLELSGNVFSYTSTSQFFPFAYGTLQFNTVYIGIDTDSRSNGLVGNIRHLKVFTTYLDDATMYKVQFTYLNPYSQLQFQVMLSDTTDITDDPSGTIGQIVGTSSQLTKVIDYVANFYCYFPASSDPNVGTVNQALQFDGVSCIDNKEKLYMTDQTSYASTTMTALTDLKAYTVEFWVRPTATVSGDAFLFVIQEPRFGTMYAVISQVTTNQLYCYTSFSQNQTAKVMFLDYVSSTKTWQHMGCIIDTNSGYVQGVYFNGQYDYVYYQEISSSAMLPKQPYNVIINSDPRYNSNGIPQAHYAEVRVWNYSRSTQDIKDYQFHQLNVDRFRVNLLSYMKLMGGGAVPSPGEIDYADSTLQRTVTLQNTQWISRTDIAICPLGTYRGSITDYNCYREGITKFQIFVVKNSTHYTVTPFYTIYRNNMLRDDSRMLFNFSWTLSSMNVNNMTNQNIFPSYFTPQKGRKELIFSYDQVSNMPGKYSIAVSMQDTANQMNVQTSTVTLATYKCLGIFDKPTQQSVLLMDMNTQRLTQDAVFNYDYTQCGSYVFDASSMTFDIDYSDKILLLNTDLNKVAQTFTLRAGVQQYLPLNEYFYIRIKGVWRNQNDKSDIIEYYLIYGCRYISKLVPQLTPNYYLVLRGQELDITYNAVYFNMPSNILNRAYTAQWVCPDSLNVYCKSQGDTLRLPYNMFLNSNLNFWQSYPITLILQTNFIQGDGTKISNGTINIVWSDVNPDASTLLASPFISKEYQIGYQVNFVNMPESQLSISWTSNPTIPSNCLLNSNTWKQFVINQTCISEGVNYNLTCNIFYLQQNQVIWTSSNVFSVPVSPRGGSISCDKTSGKAYLDQFSCSTSGWTLQTSTAKYQFYITELTTGNLIPVSGLINQQTLVTTLPPTKKLTVKVVDTNNGIGYASLTINVNYVYDDALVTKVQALVNTASSSLNSTNLQSIVAITQAAAIIDSLGNHTFQSAAQLGILDYQRNMTYSILTQAQKLNTYTDEAVRRSFIQGAVTSFSQLTENPIFFNADYSNTMMTALYTLINGTYQDSLNNLMYDTSFNKQFFNIFENIYTSLQSLLNTGNVTNAMMDAEPQNNVTLSSLTKQAKSILGVYERFISVRIFENQTFFYNNSVFSFKVTKFSRMAQNQADQIVFYPNGEYTSYNFPLSDATQPTPRQSFAVINFKVSPFIGDWYLNQSATSDSSVYFSYRDETGTYLSSENVVRRIQITYKYDYSPFIFLPNVTTCGYIGLGDSQWENSSCTVEFSRYYGNITCHCLHMSYYSIIDDYLIRPQKVPLVYLTFRNWSSFIVFLYVILVFVIGTIYTFNKDNQDFRYLHEQEELQGNTLSSENSVNLVSLTFKRKVFFMMFADKYKFSNLLKLYIMLLHPVFQLKYRLDPEHPRFYRFLLLFSRIMILFALCFYILKDVPNFENLSDSTDYGIAVVEVIILTMVGSLLLVPMPIILLCCCRSRYFLIDPKGKSREASDNEMDDDQTISRSNTNKKENQRNRISDVMIDTNIPIKLLFLVNAFKIDDIIEHYRGTLSYATGDSNHVGKKLYELDYELHQQEKAKKVQDSTDDSKNKKNKQNNKDSQQQQPEKEQTVHTQSFLKDGVQDNQQEQAIRSGSMKNISRKNPQDKTDELENQPQQQQHQQQLQLSDQRKKDKSLRDADSNRPLKFSPNKSKMADIDKTNLEMLGPHTPDYDERSSNTIKKRERRSKKQQDSARRSKKSDNQGPSNFDENYNMDEENLDDEDQNESKRKRQFFEGGEREKTNKNSGRASSKNNNNAADSNMDFDDLNGPKNNTNTNLNNKSSQSNANINNEPADEDNDEENESDLESIDTQLFVDEKKEMIEDRDRLLLAFGNSMGLILNVGLFIAVLASFIAGGYYNERNQYVWVVVFFGAQLFSFFISDILVLWLMALCVSKCCRRNKTCLTKWMRESLYIYEDYKYVVQFANTRIT